MQAVKNYSAIKANLHFCKWVGSFLRCATSIEQYSRFGVILQGRGSIVGAPWRVRRRDACGRLFAPLNVTIHIKLIIEG